MVSANRLGQRGPGRNAVSGGRGDGGQVEKRLGVFCNVPCLCGINERAICYKHEKCVSTELLRGATSSQTFTS